MNNGQRCRWAALLLALAAAGAGLIRLCSRFEGFQHPLTLPVLLCGIGLLCGVLFVLQS